MKTASISHSKKILLALLILMTPLFLTNFVSADDFDGTPEIAGSFGGGADISGVLINLTAFSKGYISSVGIIRGGGSGPSNFSVYINQSGTNIANGTILNVGISPAFFVNFTKENYSTTLERGNFTIEIYRDNGDIVFQRGINQNFSGEHFNITLGTVPAVLESAISFTPFVNFTNFKNFIPSTVLIGNTVNFGATVNISTTTSLSAVNFVFDNTVYSAGSTTLGTNAYNFTKDISVPTSTGSVDAYFNFTLANGQQGNSTVTSVTISDIGLDDCSVYSNVLYNFTLYDEQDQSKLSGSTDKTNATIDAKVYNSERTFTVSSYANSFDATNPFAICLETALDGNSDYLLDLQVQYWAEDYAKEFYNIYNNPIDDTDMNTNVSLYPLDNETAQEFRVYYRDSSFIAVPNAVIQIQRKYISEGVFKTVEQPKTDSNGETVAHLERDDAIYNFIVVVDGVVDATFNDVIAYCPNPTFEDCEIGLNKLESHIQPESYVVLDDLAFLFSFNRDTRTVTNNFNIPSGTSATMVLNVTLFDTLGTTLVCDDTLVSSGGSLTCVVPTSFGNSTMVARLYKDSEMVGQIVISLAKDPTDIYGNNLVWIALVMFLAIIGIGVTGNPVVSGMFLILASILLVAMNIFYSTGWLGTGATILWFIIAVVIVIIKGVNR